MKSLLHQSNEVSIRTEWFIIIIISPFFIFNVPCNHWIFFLEKKTDKRENCITMIWYQELFHKWIQLIEKYFCKYIFTKLLSFTNNSILICNRYQIMTDITKWLTITVSYIPWMQSNGSNQFKISFLLTCF